MTPPLRHKAKCRNPDVKHLRGVLKKSDKSFIVITAREDIFAPPSTIHHMIPGIGVFYSKRSGHGKDFIVLREMSQAKT